MRVIGKKWDGQKEPGNSQYKTEPTVDKN